MSDEADVSLDNIVFDANNDERPSWLFFGKQIPRSQTVFICQVILVFLLVSVSTICSILSPSCEERTFWVAILSSSVGYLVPSPKL